MFARAGDDGKLFYWRFLIRNLENRLTSNRRTDDAGDALFWVR